MISRLQALRPPALRWLFSNSKHKMVQMKVKIDDETMDFSFPMFSKLAENV